MPATPSTIEPYPIHTDQMAVNSRPSRGRLLRAEVATEFAEEQAKHQRQLRDIYAPPWNDRIARDEGGNYFLVEFGPASPSTYEERIREWKQSPAGGGLYDHTHKDSPEQLSPRRRRQELTRKVERADADAMRAFVEHPASRHPRRELEVYLAYYREGLSASQTAQYLSTSAAPLGVESVREYLSRLRRRMRAWWLTRPKFKCLPDN